MEPRYRQYLNEPSEALLLAQSPLLTTTRFAQFLDDSGLPMNRIITSKMCSVPIPLYVDASSAPTGRQFPADTNPHLMWHPLFWLPASLANHLSYRDADGETQTETDDQWSARVALTLGTSGVYDIENGHWLDMLSVVGLDIEDEMVIDRIKDWLEGSEDPDLDRIDLSAFTDLPDQPYWAFRSVQSIFPQLELSSYGLIANSTLEIIDMMVEENTTVEGLTSEFADAVEALTLVIGELDYDFEGKDFLALSYEVIASANEYSGDWNDFANGTVAYYRQALTSVRGTFWPVVEALVEADTAQAQE